MLAFILFFVSVFSAGSYFYHKKEIASKENMLKECLEEISSIEKATVDAEPGTAGECAGDVQANSFAGGDVEPEVIVVYICGHVNNPGVYEIDDRARISDLLELCGGAKQGACLEAVNLAKKPADGERIYVPSNEEVHESGIDLSYGDWQEVKQNNGGLININQASIEELQKLPGIGEQIAAKIIDHRQKYGLFKSKEDLKNVSGIGDKKYEQIEGLISI